MPVSSPLMNSAYAQVVFNIPIQQRFTYRVPSALIGNAFIGQRVKAPFGNRDEIGYIVAHTTLDADRSLKEIQSCFDADPLITPELLDVSQWMSQEYGCSEGEALYTILSPRIIIKKRKKKTAITDSIKTLSSGVVLTDEQTHIFQRIQTALDAYTSKIFLIHGVTASGKTEVYLTAISHVLQQKRQALYLVPEISMTPLFIQRLRERFGSTVAVWHSQLSIGERFDTWKSVLEDRTQIVIGARSAIFMPFKNIGIIVIDEEHDESYKQDQKPYYHCREIAEKRIMAHNAVLVLGSATPSIESYTKARENTYELCQLPQRIDKKPMPEVSLIDMSQGRIGRSFEIFSPQLKQAIQQRLARREQVILFLNRRGYAPFIRCLQCGWVGCCKQCAVSLVYHRKPFGSSAEIKQQNFFTFQKQHGFSQKLEDRPDASGCDERLVCHYCGVTSSLPDVCPECKTKMLRLAGVGTQKVEQELRRLFPQARVARLDRDTASKKNYSRTLFHDFKNEHIDILIGTQIVVKGFDFPRVTLVGVIDADIALHLPDFRAGERTFQLITQVAGRAGRSALGGEAIVQTFHPNHYAVACAQKHDYESFFKKEIEIRKSLGYPPFKRLMSMVFRGFKEDVVRVECEHFADRLREHIPRDSFELLGPAPAQRPMLHGKHRWQIIVKAHRDVCRAIFDLVKTWHVRPGVLLSAEIDPLSLL